VSAGQRRVDDSRILDPRPHAHPRQLLVRDDVDRMVGRRERLSLVHRQKPRTVEEGLCDPGQQVGEMLHVMLRPSLRTPRVLKEPHPLLVHCVVINRLSGRDECLSQPCPPAEDHFEQESVGCHLTHRVTNAGPTQELKREPASHILPVLIGERPYPCRYFTPCSSRRRLHQREGLLGSVALLSLLVDHGVVPGLDGRVTDTLQEGALAREHDGRDPLAVVREITQIELRHDVVPSRLPWRCARLVLQVSLPAQSGYSAHRHDAEFGQLRLSTAPCH
jgi:hypothetical protein